MAPWIFLKGRFNNEYPTLRFGYTSHILLVLIMELQDWKYHAEDSGDNMDSNSDLES